MEKRLDITGINCKLSRTDYTVKIDNEAIESIITKSLPPDMEKYEDYMGDISITISIHGSNKIVKTKGYEIPVETENEEG